MRYQLKQAILETSDLQQQLRIAEQFVAQGELEEFIVNGKRMTFIDRKDEPKKEAFSHIDTLEKLKGFYLGALYDGDPEKAAIYNEAIQRLHSLFPDLRNLEKEYEEQVAQMRERWGGAERE